jgi:hypothetical protein
MTKEEIEHIIKLTMNNKTIRSQFDFINDYEIFDTPRDFIETLFLYGTSLQEVKDFIKTNRKLLRKEKLKKIKNG